MLFRARHHPGARGAGPPAGRMRQAGLGVSRLMPARKAAACRLQPRYRFARMGQLHPAAADTRSGHANTSPVRTAQAAGRGAGGEAELAQDVAAVTGWVVVLRSTCACIAAVMATSQMSGMRGGGLPVPLLAPRISDSPVPGIRPSTLVSPSALMTSPPVGFCRIPGPSLTFVNGISRSSKCQSAHC